MGRIKDFALNKISQQTRIPISKINIALGIPVKKECQAALKAKELCQTLKFGSVEQHNALLEWIEHVTTTAEAELALADAKLTENDDIITLAFKKLVLLTCSPTKLREMADDAEWGSDEETIVLERLLEFATTYEEVLWIYDKSFLGEQEQELILAKLLEFANTAAKVRQTYLNARQFDFFPVIERMALRKLVTFYGWKK